MFYSQDMAEVLGGSYDHHDDTSREVETPETDIDVDTPPQEDNESVGVGVGVDGDADVVDDVVDDVIPDDGDTALENNQRQSREAAEASVINDTQHDLAELEQILRNTLKVSPQLEDIQEHIDIVERVFDGNAAIEEQKNEIIATMEGDDKFTTFINKFIDVANKLLSWLWFKSQNASPQAKIDAINRELKWLDLPTPQALWEMAKNTDPVWDPETFDLMMDTDTLPLTQLWAEKQQRKELRAALEEKMYDAKAAWQRFHTMAYLKYMTQLTSHIRLAEKLEQAVASSDTADDTLERISRNSYEYLVRPHIQPGDIVLINYTSSSGIVDKGLQDGSGSPFIHVGMLGYDVDNPNDTDYSFFHSTLNPRQRRAPGVEQVPSFERYVNQLAQRGAVDIMVVRPQYTDDQLAKAMDIAASYEGTGYDNRAATSALDVGGILWRLWWRQDPDKFNCGEYVAAILQAVYGIELDDNVSPLPGTYKELAKWHSNLFSLSSLIHYPAQ